MPISSSLIHIFAQVYVSQVLADRVQHSELAHLVHSTGLGKFGPRCRCYLSSNSALECAIQDQPACGGVAGRDYVPLE